MKGKKFCVRYYHNGLWYGTYIQADTWEDADEICAAHNLQNDGQLICSVPAVLGGAVIVRIICWFKNTFNRDHQ